MRGSVTDTRPFSKKINAHFALWEKGSKVAAPSASHTSGDQQQLVQIAPLNGSHWAFRFDLGDFKVMVNLTLLIPGELYVSKCNKLTRPAAHAPIFGPCSARRHVRRTFGGELIPAHRGGVQAVMLLADR